MVFKIASISGIDFVQSVDVKKSKGSIGQIQKQLQGFYKQCALLRPILEVDSVCMHLLSILFSVLPKLPSALSNRVFFDDLPLQGILSGDENDPSAFSPDLANVSCSGSC